VRRAILRTKTTTLRIARLKGEQILREVELWNPKKESVDKKEPEHFNGKRQTGQRASSQVGDTKEEAS
jgi:hypothetical protein